MKGKTAMEISRDEMIAIVEFYLNNNLLNTTFQEHHKSRVVNVRERTSGRFFVEFYADKQPQGVTTVSAKAATGGGQ